MKTYTSIQKLFGDKSISHVFPPTHDTFLDDELEKFGFYGIIDSLYEITYTHPDMRLI